MNEADEAGWRHKMARRKQLQDAKTAASSREKGLLIVHTGTGKGKTTAALGMILRMAGHGFRSALIQFVKGGWSPGELSALARFEDLVTVRVMGEGFTWNTADRTRDIAASRLAWQAACDLFTDPSYRLVVLDELNIALRYDFLPVIEIVTTLAERRPDLHVVVTGRNAPGELIEAADLVTDMQAVKHPFRSGIKAQPGLEY
ncbi:MAG: cob(I)yrinic acid a,c-diamide adenosyltransferase [Rhodospirillaceae bacterium]